MIQTIILKFYTTICITTTIVMALQFSIDTTNILYEVNMPYLSFNIDSASLYQDNEGGRLNFTDPQLISLGKQFCTSSPQGAILRIGGSGTQ